MTGRGDQRFLALRLSDPPAGSIALIGTAVPALEPLLVLAPQLAPAGNGIAGLVFLRLALPRFRRACLS